MKTLLKKEFKFASVLTYVFLAFSAMALIPNYPILIGAFFICFGIFHSFQSAREANDTLYTALLPVKKRDVVNAKYLFAVTVQLAAFALTSVFAAIRMCVLNNFSGYASAKLMNANLVYLAFVLLIYSAFNLLFIDGFYKTAYKIGVPFLKFGIAAAIILFVGESLHFIPATAFLNENFRYSHLIVFFAAAAIYALTLLVSARNSQRNFDKLDL